MNKAGHLKYKIIRIVLIVMCAIGIGTVAVYPFDNRNLLLKFITDKGEFLEQENNVDIVEGRCKSILFEGVEDITIKEVVIYGSFTSMYIKKIGFVDFTGYINSTADLEMRWEDNGLYLADATGINLDMNGEYQDMLRELSGTFMQERLIMMGWCIVAGALGWLVVGVIEEKRNRSLNHNHQITYEFGRFFSDLKKYKQYMVFAAKADLRAEVADSYLNRLWWLLEPFFNMIVYVIVFGNVMGSSIQYYSTFTFSSLLMWNFFNKIINYSVKLVRNNKDILSKVYIPKFVLLLSNMILNMYKLLFSMLVLVVMLIVYQVHIGINIIWVIPAYLLMVLLAFGMGMILLHFGVYVDDLSYAVGILMTMLMFLSGIFYETMSTLPEPLNMLLMHLNPATIFIDTMRNALLYNQATNLPVLGLWLMLSLVLCGMGIHIVYKNENSYVKIV